MKKQVRVVVVMLIVVVLTLGLPNFDVRAGMMQDKPGETQISAQFVRGRMLVKFRPDTLALTKGSLLAAAGANDAGEIAGIGVHILELSPGLDESAFVDAFNARSEIEFAELDYRYVLASMPNDPYYANEWHLPRVKAPNAWTSTTGSSSVIIAILDTGVDGNHPDLMQKMLPGWNFYDNHSDTSDVYGHGTAVAGTVAASSNNGTGVAALAWGCKILPVRISRPDGYADTSTIANGLIWAADHGARVANISYAASGSPTVSS